MHPGGKQAFKRIARGLHPSYYGEQPKVRALIPFAVNEALAHEIRDLKPHVRNVIPATAVANPYASDRTLARLERFRSRKALGEHPGKEHEPELA